MKRASPLIAGIALVLIGIIGLLVVYVASPRREAAYGPVIDGRRSLRASEFRGNGERIYYTATSSSGDPIGFVGGPHWLHMHGGSCVSCHGPGGRGGIQIPMTSQVAPDIRYSTLTSEKHDEEHPPYTKALIKRAITDGLDPAGEPLHWTMPRWRMSDADLNDLVEYLNTLDSK